MIASSDAAKASIRPVPAGSLAACPRSAPAKRMLRSRMSGRLVAPRRVISMGLYRRDAAACLAHFRPVLNYGFRHSGLRGQNTAGLIPQGTERLSALATELVNRKARPFAG